MWEYCATCLGILTIFGCSGNFPFAENHKIREGFGWDGILKIIPAMAENLPLEFYGQFYVPRVWAGFEKALKNHLVPAPPPDPRRNNAVLEGLVSPCYWLQF